MGVGMKDSVDL